MIFETKIINSNEELREYIPYMKESKKNVVVAVSLYSNAACLFFFARDLADMASGVGVEYMTHSTVPVILTEIGGQEEPMLVLDSFDVIDIRGAFHAYNQSVIDGETAHILGDTEELLSQYAKAVELQDYLADEYNVKVDSRQKNVEFELFDA